MDDGKGKFKFLDSQIEALKASGALGRGPEQSGVFQVGETLEIRGSKFLVLRITRKEMHLKLLPR